MHPERWARVAGRASGGAERAGRPGRRPDWPAYLSGFHAQHPGITEQVLRRARRGPQAGADGTATPYEWLLQAVPPRGSVLDLACGSAPVWPRLRDRRYLGMDISVAELGQARRSGAGPLFRASGTAIPLGAASVDTVICSMALMLLTPLPAVLAEIRRVLPTGGTLTAMVPAHGPLRPGDLPVVAGLLAALGPLRRLPGGAALRGARGLLADAGLRLTGDERRRFGYRLASRADAELLLYSLYLPGTSHRRLTLARGYLRALALASTGFPVPVRRLIAIAE